jgi:predicted transcriptional regulator
METKARVRREDKIAVMFSSDMRRRLNVLAEGFGMPPSTLCAFAVASWVQQQENNLAMTRNAITQITNQAGEMLDAVLVDELAKASLVQVNRKMDTQGLLPLDDAV